jgi:hypothetical protein
MERHPAGHFHRPPVDFAACHRFVFPVCQIFSDLLLLQLREFRNGNCVRYR